MAREKTSIKQQEILQYIKDVTLSRGYPPAVREIGQAVGLKSTASVHSYLSALEEQGLIRRDPSKPRAIEIMDDDFAVGRREISSIPVVGNVAAGEPLLAEQNVLDYFPLPADMLPNENVFMLRVRGDSMIGSGILDGDMVVVKEAHTASNGDLVVAMIEDGATVKYYYKENGHFRLQPDNPDYDPIITDNVSVLGSVIGVIRMF